VKIRKVEIQNFRGINQLSWSLPDEQIICLIGKGDSTKSTILEAIRRTFSPQWNLSFNDSDFYGCEPEAPITIEIVLGNLPEIFCSNSKYGNHLRGWNIGTQKLHDEPHDDDEIALSIRLTVQKDLEPTWKVVTERHPDGANFKAADRKKVNVSLIGDYSEKQLTWAAGSALSHLTETESLNASLAEASRAACHALDDDREALKPFDRVAHQAEKVARTLGIPVSKEFRAQLDLSSISIRSGGLTLHDGNIPLRQLGLGSRRMLLCGIQQDYLVDQHITLFDELEYGLEPHRITRLIRNIKDDSRGQYFITTHSPTVLRELTTAQLNVTHSSTDEVQVIHTAAPYLDGLNIQGHLRSSAEAFLSKKVLICEGATEVGFLRALDYVWEQQGKMSFSYCGIALLDAKGASKVRGLAEGFHGLRYDVCVLVDNDAPIQFSNDDATALSKQGIKVVMCPKNSAIEQSVINDLPWLDVLASVSLATELNRPALQNVRSKFDAALPSDISQWPESLELRTAIGDAAKASGWFKNITDAEHWVETIAASLTSIAFEDSGMGSRIVKLREWIDHD